MISQRIKELRLENHLTQKELSDYLGLTPKESKDSASLSATRGSYCSKPISCSLAAKMLFTTKMISHAQSR